VLRPCRYIRRSIRTSQRKNCSSVYAVTAFERDFADPVDDARGHLSEDLDGERYRQRQLFARTRKAA
jgi:hypothetical protein